MKIFLEHGVLQLIIKRAVNSIPLAFISEMNFWWFLEEKKNKKN